MAHIMLASSKLAVSTNLVIIIAYGSSILLIGIRVVYFVCVETFFKFTNF